MFIRITQVYPAAGGHRVAFDTARGEATGEWMGEPPSVGDERFVEFEFGERLVRGVNVFEIESVPSTFGYGEGGSVCATVERVEPDCVTLRLFDSLILTDMLPQSAAEGMRLEIRTAELRLYDIKL